MEPMLIQHVMPELTSSEPFLRSRACWLYGEFGSFKYENEPTLKQAVDGVYKNLFSEELPVRLSAAVALSRLLDNKTAQDFLRPALRSIFEVYLKTIEEIESEDLVQSLNEFMTVFQNDIAPFTVQIATNLTS
jgi:hypothetical protein